MKASGESAMKILSLEFSSSQRSVAVLTAGRSHDGSNERILSATEITETGVAGTHALAMVDEALRRAGVERAAIEAIAVGLGPGSYTGIRSAIATAQGWQLARAVKLIGVSSALGIAAEAQQNGATGRVHVVIDAQRDEFYLATYDLSATECVEVAPLRIVSREEIQNRESKGGLLIGPEIDRWFTPLVSPDPSGSGLTNGVRSRTIFPRAETIGRMAARLKDSVNGDPLEPIYLRETKFIKAPAPRIL
jgi:tRNA threonylcarbamoyl adenosine modification protein YeaZ